MMSDNWELNPTNIYQRSEFLTKNQNKEVEKFVKCEFESLADLNNKTKITYLMMQSIIEDVSKLYDFDTASLSSIDNINQSDDEMDNQIDPPSELAATQVEKVLNLVETGLNFKRAKAVFARGNSLFYCVWIPNVGYCKCGICSNYEDFEKRYSTYFYKFIYLMIEISGKDKFKVELIIQQRLKPYIMPPELINDDNIENENDNIENDNIIIINNNENNENIFHHNIRIKGRNSNHEFYKTKVTLRELYEDSQNCDVIGHFLEWYLNKEVINKPECAGNYKIFYFN